MHLSVLIAARNEAAHIEACLQSILSQAYPPELMEVLVIDDHSTDDTAHLAANIKDTRLRLLSLKEGHGKKAAIAKGISAANSELIVCTDADCIVPPNWLTYISSFYEKSAAKFIAAPVNFHQERNHFEQFQSLDFIGMMGITGAGIQLRFMHMCNGANLAYPKAVFQEVGGFEGIDGLASGDDMLLLQKIAARYPQDIGFLKNKNATVLTSAMPNWRSFLQQRLRWASKSSHYLEWQVTAISAIVFLGCVNLLLSLLLIPVWGASLFLVFLVQLIVKSVADFLFLKQISHFFGRSDLLSHFGYAQVLHISYILSIGIWAMVKTDYSWKGRKLR